MATAKKIQSDISSLKIAIRVAKNDAIKKKLKSRLEMAENELASIKSGAKPRKVSTTKGTKSLLEKAKALVKKNPKFAQYKGSGVDLEKDAKEGALPIGRRISKGLKANQVSGKGNAKQNKGNVYYEYRVNRLDVKQPKGKQSYPKLEDGGYMAKGGIIYLESVGTYFRPSDMTTSPDKKFENEGEITYVFENSDEWWDALSTNDREKIKKYEKREMGGYMAKGGIYSSDSLYILTVSKDGKEVAKERFRAKSMKEARMMGEDMEDGYKSQFGGDLSFSISEAMANGGMMTKMKMFDLYGEAFVIDLDVKNYVIRVERIDDEVQYTVVDVRGGEKSFDFESEALDYISKKVGRKVKPNNEMASGGMMAKGGKLDVGVYRVGKPTKVSPMLYEQKIVEIFGNGDIATASDYGRKLSDFNLQKYPIISKEQLDAQYKMAYGGYMAKGGEIIPYIIWVSKDGEKREFYGEYKSQRAAEMAMKKLWDSSDYKSMGNKPKKMYEKDGFYKYGGYMAFGGIVAHGLEVGDTIVHTDGDNIYVRNQLYQYKVNLPTGKREFDKFVGNTNSGYMAHGGETHRAEDPEVEVDEDEMKVIRGYSDDEAYEYAKGGVTLNPGDIVEATTGVKLKVMDFKPDFGGRALVQRIDEFGEGLKPAWMPLTKFKLPKLI